MVSARNERRVRPCAAWLVAVVSVVMAVCAGQARAAEGRDARELEAKTACLGGHVNVGIEILARLYAETNDATYLYNQGRCFEQNGKPAEAVTRFREYLRKASGITSEERADVQAHINEMEAEAKSASAAPVAPAAVGPSAAASPAPAAEQVGLKAEASQPATLSASAARKLRIAGVASAATGAVFLGGGLYFGAQARSISEEVTRNAAKGVYSPSRYDDGKRAETLQWVGYGIGAAALVGGGVLFLIGARHPSAEGADVALVPEVGRGHAGASVEARF
jgi:hypothetical protein